MLFIRPEQLAVLQRDAVAQFARRLAAHLRTMFEDELEGVDEPALVALAARAIAKAESYGIVYQSDVARFAEYCVFYGEQFDADPLTAWAGEILRDPGIDGKEKMNRIDIRTRDIYRRE